MNYKDNLFRKTLDILIRALYPKRCPECGKIIPINETYCRCFRDESVKISNNYCRHCANEAENCVCGFGNTIPLPDVAAVYIYGGKIRADILNLKFNNEKRLAVKLGEMMAERVAYAYADIDFDIVTYVPMSDRSYNVRTYNQSELLAKQVGKMLFCPVEDVFKKIRQTSRQHELGGKERVQNVQNSVELYNRDNIKGKTILICDDVKTTGATLSQCVSLLEEAGAERVCCICIAVSDFKKQL